MNDQQKHLSQLLEQEQELLVEINNLNSQITSKRDLLLKVQGVLEYLTQTGVTLPETAKVEEKKEEENEESREKQ